MFHALLSGSASKLLASYLCHACVIQEIIQTGWGSEEMEFQGLLNKKHGEIPGFN